MEIKQDKNGDYYIPHILGCREAKILICMKCGKKPASLQEAERFHFWTGLMSCLIEGMYCKDCYKKE